MYFPFNVLALGTQFKYNQFDNRTFVKIGSNEIAEWDDDMITSNWIGQMIYSFDNSINLEKEVWVIESL